MARIFSDEDIFTDCVPFTMGASGCRPVVFSASQWSLNAGQVYGGCTDDVETKTIELFRPDVDVFG